MILSYYPVDAREKLKAIMNDNENAIFAILKKISNKEFIHQEELDLLADYLYTKKDLNSLEYQKYLSYLLNDIKNNKDVKNSPRVIAAYIAYLPKIFGEGCEDSRVLLTNGYASNGISILPNVLDDVVKKERAKSNLKKTIQYKALYSHSDKYVSIAKNLLNFSITSDKSLDNSRTMINRDLYWISMVCFHELTHQYQRKRMKESKFDSSGFAMLLRLLISNSCDYNNNHDSYETEIEADEFAWKKMYDFIFQYRLKNAASEDRKNIEEQLRKCRTNQKAVYCRRTFLTKKDENDKSDYFFDDMKMIMDNFQNKSGFSENFKKMCATYPMLQKLFTTDGKVKTTLLLNENITSSDYDGLDNNIMGSEISSYLFTLGYPSLKKHVLEDHLTEHQVQNLMINIYNTYHLDKMFVRALSSVDLEQYKETHHNFNLANIRKKYLEKFKNVALLVYKERELVSIINRKYPNYDVSSSAKYAMWNYNDMFKYLCEASDGFLDYHEIEDVINLYEGSSDPILLELARSTKAYFSPMDNLDSSFNR